nr:MAG TPA: hypothetical protein [Bacteriophage sp.]
MRYARYGDSHTSERETCIDYYFVLGVLSCVEVNQTFSLCIPRP